MNNINAKMFKQMTYVNRRNDSIVNAMKIIMMNEIMNYDKNFLFHEVKHA